MAISETITALESGAIRRIEKLRKNVVSCVIIACNYFRIWSGLSL